MFPGLIAWDARKVQQVFSTEDAQNILSCPIAKAKEDVMIRGHHSSGTYTTRSGHKWLMSKEENRQICGRCLLNSRCFQKSGSLDGDLAKIRYRLDKKYGQHS
ncbi:hypothetical protein V6N13_065683 [Hibiscus sabdariffa]